MKQHHQVITIAIALLLAAVVLHPFLNEVEKVLTNCSELISNRVIIPV